MWELVDPDLRKRDFTWIKEAMNKGTLVCCADGSYRKKISPWVSGAGWVVHCRKSGQSIEGSFYEVSDSANAYRAEQLGMDALHHLLAAFSVFYGIKEWRSKAGCDNLGTIKICRRRFSRIRPGMKCADVLRNIRSARNKMTTRPDYFHVLGHMDDYLAEEQLTLEQTLNKRCDALAKHAVDVWLQRKRAGRERESKQLLPCETAAVMINGQKVTGDIAEAIRYAKGMEEARRFLVEEQGWTHEQFDEVDWKVLHRVMRNKPKGFSTWLAKQHSGFCGTAVQVGHYSGEEDPDTRCPNCGCREDAGHLCVCPSAERTRLLEENTAELEVWLHKDGKTDPQLAYWLGKYIMGRGEIKFAELGQMTEDVSRLARGQDLIGYRNFMEGRVTKEFQKVQGHHLMDADGHLSGFDWVKGLITKVLQITHSQWIFRNMTLHDREGGELRRREAQ